MWSKTLSYKHLHSTNTTNAELAGLKFTIIRSFGLKNGDKVESSNFVFANISSCNGLSIGKVVEALQILGSDSELRREPDLVLLALYRVGTPTPQYCMPALSDTKGYVLIEFSVYSCNFISQIMLIDNPLEYCLHSQCTAQLLQK